MTWGFCGPYTSAKRGLTGRAHGSHAAHDAISHFQGAALHIAEQANWPLHYWHWTQRSPASTSCIRKRQCRLVDALQLAERAPVPFAGLALLDALHLSLVESLLHRQLLRSLGVQRLRSQELDVKLVALVLGMLPFVAAWRRGEARAAAQDEQEQAAATRPP